MRSAFVSKAVLALSCGALGCSATVPPARPVGLPPTPKTVTVENPGGDASDPEWAALDRLVHEPWGILRDRTRTLVVPLQDARHWQRVRLWGYPSRSAFRFGDDHYGVLAIWYTPTTEDDSPDACLARFVAEARPIADTFGAHVIETHVVQTVQRAGTSLRPMAVQVVDAEVEGLFSTKAYAGALAAYQSWPGTCLIQGFVVPASKHKALAARVRDRWVTEGATRLNWTARVLAAPEFDDK